MVDFLKKIVNSDKFRTPALTYLKTGAYCLYPIGTTEYYLYWDELKERCINGYTADDGDFITGYNYFYINFCPMLRIVNEVIELPDGSTKIKKTDAVTFPDFYDYDYFYFHAVLQAEECGKHVCLLKSRRKGFSYKGGAMACRNFYLIPNSKTYIYASNKQYLTEDGILTKSWDYMDFIDLHTAWGKKRSVSTSMRRRAGFWTKDEFGNETEMGYKSEIIGVTLKDNPDVVRGKRAKLILFEEGGSFSELGAAWQIARPSVEHDGFAFGTMIVWGTGGDPGSAFDTLKDMFYNPGGYNCLGFLNIWDSTPTDKLCGFFVPLYTNLDTRDASGKRIYMDEDGNTITKPSLEFILEERRKVISTATNTTAIDRYVAERPVTPQEAMLEFNGNIFPKKELQELLGLIRTNKLLQNHKQVGDLVFDESGNLKWIPKKHGDIVKYPLGKEDDPTGSIVIWEHPAKDTTLGLYIIGVDPYDHDQSGTNSLGSAIVYKRFLNFEEYYDIIVAEYTGRPPTAEEYYENLRKLAIYYNARIMYENERKGLFPYFTAKHCDYLLADQPDIINDIVSNSKVQRRKGCHMNKLIKLWGEGMIKEWLNEEYAPGKKNLTRILSEPLLEELISYNDKGNFDRCVLKDTKITTLTGYKNVLDITTDDYVFTDKGKFLKVVWIDKHTHCGKVVKLKLAGDYRELECTDNHPILVAYTDKKKHKHRKEAIQNILFLRADSLNYKYQFGLLPKRKLCGTLDLPDELMYTLGWIMADGYINPKSNAVTIVFLKNQLRCANRCKDAIENYLHDEKKYTTKNGRELDRKETIIKDCSNCYRLIVHSVKLHTLATKFGCLANNKRIAIDLFNTVSHKFMMPFIIGYLEGDGHQKLNVNYDGYTRNGIELSTIYEELLLLVRLILIDNGIWCSIRKINSRRGYKPLYRMLISGSYVDKLLSMYNSSKYIKPLLSKGRSNVLETEYGFWVPIKLSEVTEINDQVYNFEVENDHTYVANGITTHNCMALMLVMIYREQLYNIVVKKKEKENKSMLLFDGPIFAQSWFNDDKPNISFNDDNVYTF